jgi:hypothetical protein
VTGVVVGVLTAFKPPVGGTEVVGLVTGVSPPVGAAGVNAPVGLVTGVRVPVGLVTGVKVPAGAVVPRSGVAFLPPWGRGTMRSMVEGRLPPPPALLKPRPQGDAV